MVTSYTTSNLVLSQEFTWRYIVPPTVKPPTFNYNNYFDKSPNFNFAYFDGKPSNISAANNTRYTVSLECFYFG